MRSRATRVLRLVAALAVGSSAPVCAASIVAVAFHNTLAASDYALIDDATLTPRLSYWAALLWRRLMGLTVLDAGPSQPGLHVYAQCLRDRPGGVALLAIDLDRTRPASLDLPLDAERYSLTADDLERSDVRLNGRTLALSSSGRLPGLRFERAAKGTTSLPAASIDFFAMPRAANPACMKSDSTRDQASG